jgi:REP element-mobilizing transposase RayT
MGFRHFSGLGRHLVFLAKLSWSFGPWSLDIFLCEFQAPDGRTENSPGLQPWERHAQGNRPERASEWHCLQRIYMLLYAIAQSLSHLIVHAVFSTKDRRALLRSEEIRGETYSYMAGILKNLQCHPIKIDGADDHVHILSSLSRNIAFTEMIGRVKGSSSKRLSEKESWALHGKMDTGLSQSASRA